MNCYPHRRIPRPVVAAVAALILLTFVVLLARQGWGQQLPLTVEAAAPALAGPGERDALARRLRLARRQAETVGPRHPHFQAVQRRVADLEDQLRRLTQPQQPILPGEIAGAFPRDQPASRQAQAPDPKPLPAADEAAAPQRGGSDQPAATRVHGRSATQSIKPPITPESFELLGGWLLPSKGAGGKGLGFSRGGLYVEHGVGRERTLYTYGHQQAAACHLLKVSLDRMGRDAGQRLSWPVAQPIKLLKKTHDIRRNSPYNICRPNPDGPLLTTGRVFYATKEGDFVGPWMNWYSESDGPMGPLAVESHVDRRQPFGGGFCTIPKWFADEYLDGRDFGVGFGGYRSGQDSSPGPTFFAADRPANGSPQLNNCVELLSFKWNAGKGGREERPADYTTPLWGPPVENGMGWWQADLVVAGPAWVDTPDVTGLCYWVLQGLGDLDYKLQSATFGRERRVRLYVYDPSDFVDVLEGQKRPNQVRGSFHEWPLPFDSSSKAKRFPIGAYWDAADRLLYISYAESGSGRYEIPPAVVVYKVR